MDDVQAKYETALQSLISKVEADTTILAAILFGSLSYDTVWRRSDIDMMLVTQETRLKNEGYCLVEEGVNIHAFLTTRSEFRRTLEGAVQGSFIHSMLVKGRMLFCRDEALAELFETRRHLSERDRAIQLLQVASAVLPGLAKAEKWLMVKRDFDYCKYWILHCTTPLAKIETLLQGEIPGREVIQQALKTNPELFHALYTDLLNQPTTEESVKQALVLMTEYLHTHTAVLFASIFSYLQEESELRSMTDINHYFARHYNIESVEIACEWLADEGYIQKFATPVRLTDKSRVNVEEAAYTYSGEERS